MSNVKHTRTELYDKLIELLDPLPLQTQFDVIDIILELQLEILDRTSEEHKKTISNVFSVIKSKKVDK